MPKKDNQKEINVLPVKKERTYKSPTDNSNFETKPGEISKMINQSLIFFDLPRVTSDAELQERIILYFTTCAEKDTKPSVAGMALAIGYDRTTLHDWQIGRNHGFSSHTSDIIKKAKLLMASMTEQMAQDGKVNPAIAIFLLKNHFGYKDVNDVVLSQTASEETPESVLAKYDELPD